MDPHHLIVPLRANAWKFAMDKATVEGKMTTVLLILLSFRSWTVIINKALQLYKASKMAKKFFSAYRATRDPLEIFNKGQEFSGAPAYEVYYTGAEELTYHLKNNPVQVVRAAPVSDNNVPEAVRSAHTDVLARSITTK